jgi:beta-glucosidase
MSSGKNNLEDSFHWGVSAAAYQTEGAWDEDGKGLSIWDVFAHKKGKIFNNQNGDLACDFYHRYATDLDLLHQLQIPNFRFSIAWSRIMPNGDGKLNPQGISFYNKLIDSCLQHNIVPWITLYHWDLPYELEKQGGWTNRKIIEWFNNYVSVCIKHFGDRVKNWIVLNEPMAFTGAGYFLGLHAPGRKGLNNFLAAVHHAALCQAEGGRIIRAMKSDAFIGTTFSCSLVQPINDSPRNISASVKADALLNRLFIEPLSGLGYPSTDLKFLQQIELFMQHGDEEKLKFDMDFIGLQNYTREIVKFNWMVPYLKTRPVPAIKRGVETTSMKWEIYPESIHAMLHQFSSYKMHKQIIVTENGAAFKDVNHNGEIKDTKRKDYLNQYIHQVWKAKEEGVNVTGYFVWSFTDNFEWAEGFNPRFGLVYVDYQTQARIIKNSGYWYSQFIRRFRGLN